MNLYEITFISEGNLSNPDITSPSYVEAKSRFNSLEVFLLSCKNSRHKEREFTPNKIKSKLLISINDIIK